MANQEHLDVLKQGVETWNRWRQEHPDIQPDLSGTKLRNANFSRANFSRANLRNTELAHTIFTNTDLSEANLYGAFLAEANFISADLSRTILDSADFGWAFLNGAILRGATLMYASVIGTDLSDADLSGSHLFYTRFKQTKLSGTDFKQARMENTAFEDVDLSVARELDAISHTGPSSIGIDTIYRSHGQIPESFLRKAGVPDSFLEVMVAITNRPIEYYTVFISYSSKDQTFAERLYADLQSKGVRCWFAPEDLKIGDKIRPRIDESIRLYDKLLLVLSEHSVASNWVEHEVEMALAKEHKEKRTVLFPVRLDRAILEREYDGWPALVRHERHIGDFTRWKDHDSYQQAFDRLLRDLKAKPKTSERRETDGESRTS